MRSRSKVVRRRVPRAQLEIRADGILEEHRGIVLHVLGKLDPLRTQFVKTPVHPVEIGPRPEPERDPRLRRNHLEVFDDPYEARDRAWTGRLEVLRDVVRSLVTR